MRLAGKVAVVTGGGSGIGRALAQAIAGEGAAGVAVADIDGGAAAAVAEEVGGAAVGVACDVTREDDLRALLARTEEAFGAIDAFFANAGTAAGSDEQTPDEIWDRAFAVNVRAHVTAARMLVPRWLERGSGCFVVTASAAGLLTQIGVAPYAVTKHAAVAFAEWLAVTYGDRGIHVSCVCPMAVDTPMARGGMEPVAIASVMAAGAVLTPEDVAAAVIDGLADERFLILPHPEVLEYVRRKASDHERWLRGMRRLRRASESTVQSPPKENANVRTGQDLQR